MLVLALILVTSPAFFVQADSLRLRETPDESARVVARLRINTALQVHERRAEWAQVKVGPDGPTGWALGKLIGPAKVTVLSLAREPDVLTRLERLVALDGTKAAAWRELKGAYLTGGFKDKA